MPAMFPTLPNRGAGRGADHGADRGVNSAAGHGADRGANNGAGPGAGRGADDGADRGVNSAANRGADDGADRGVNSGAGRGADRGPREAFRTNRARPGHEAYDAPRAPRALRVAHVCASCAVVALLVSGVALLTAGPGAFSAAEPALRDAFVRNQRFVGAVNVGAGVGLGWTSLSVVRGGLIARRWLFAVVALALVVNTIALIIRAVGLGIVIVICALLPVVLLLVRGDVSAYLHRKKLEKDCG